MPGFSLNSNQLDRCLRIWLAGSAIALIAATFPLWFPSSTNVFPQIPLAQVALDAPLWIDWLVSALLLVAWVLVASGRWRTASVALLVVMGIATVLLNQQRLQPWHYQLVLSAFLIAIPPSKHDRQSDTWLGPLRIFTISIYIYSSVSKFDYEFLHTVGAQMLETTFTWFGFEGRPTPLAVSALPVGELLLGVLLCWSKTRRLAGILACAFHLGLIILLSPIGLNHSWGVLLWNLHFIGLSLLLFVLPTQPERTAVEADATSPESPKGALKANSKHPLRLIAIGILIPAITLPLLERTGFWDHWPSWALYAPHSSRVRIQVATNYLDRLPTDLRSEIEAQPASVEPPLWTYVPIDQWSLKACYAPVYPQARVQLGIAEYLSHEIDSEFGVRAELLGPASRLNGQRSSKILDTRREILEASRQFFLNTTPRL